MPRMLPNEPATFTLVETTETMGQSMNLIFTAQIIICIVLAASLKSMWNLMNFAQVLLYVEYFTMHFPANVTMLFSMVG